MKQMVDCVIFCLEHLINFSWRMSSIIESTCRLFIWRLPVLEDATIESIDRKYEETRNQRTK
jgi:hypothetical protein